MKALTCALLFCLPAAAMANEPAPEPAPFGELKIVPVSPPLELREAVRGESCYFIRLLRPAIPEAEAEAGAKKGPRMIPLEAQARIQPLVNETTCLTRSQVLKAVR